MLTGEEINNRPVRPAGPVGRDRGIVMIAPRNLTTECLVEVLVKNFPDSDVLRHDDDSGLGFEDGEHSGLVLIYRPRPDRIWDMLARLREHGSGRSIGILVASIDEAEDIFQRMSDTGIVDGVVPLDLRLDVFLAAVRLLAKGGEHFPSALLQRLRRVAGEPLFDRKRSVPDGAQAARDGRVEPQEIALTTREVQILDLLCSGTQNKIIADRLRLSENTVKIHIRNIYKKLRVRNRTEAAARFFRSDFAASSTPNRKG